MTSKLYGGSIIGTLNSTDVNSNEGQPTRRHKHNNSKCNDASEMENSGKGNIV